MQCGYVVAPRGHVHQSFTPTGENGMKYQQLLFLHYSYRMKHQLVRVFLSMPEMAAG
jgi:hypothetical protein